MGTAIEDTETVSYQELLQKNQELRVQIATIAELLFDTGDEAERTETFEDILKEIRVLQGDREALYRLD